MMTQREQWIEIVRRLEALPSKRLLRAFYALDGSVCAVAAALPGIESCVARIPQGDGIDPALGDVDILTMYQRSSEVRELIDDAGFDTDALESLQAWNDRPELMGASEEQRYAYVLDRARTTLTRLTRSGTP